VPEAEAEQLKKVKKSTSEVPVEKKRKGNAPSTTITAHSLTRFIAVEDSTPVATKKSKKPKPAAADELDTTLATTKPKKSEKKSEPKSKKTKEPKPKDTIPDEEEEKEFGSSDDEGDSEVDDQTVALLKGFESDGDEEDATKEGGLKEGKKVPKVPTLTNQNKKAMKRAAESDTPEKPGVVFVGHIPHGFYEHEMRAYFEQFGTILQLRLSRNPKTGASKHYAFIQFASASVAEIVAKTMDSYLLFNHILKVRLIPDEQVPETLFKGANRRFKKIPWNKMAGRKLALGSTEAEWEKRIETEETRRADKAEKMKAIGYEFDAPQIKSAKGVAKKPTVLPAAAANGEDETKAIEAAPVVEESSKPKKEKKEKKPKAAAEKPKAITEDAAASTTDLPEKKLKRKKSKTALVEPAAEEVAEEPKKTKKSKKVKADA
jgi:nucleolar protein 15